MNLPAILDIVIGLVFIYLILSLLASEIQELIATILQWRAVHLKRSIEILLTGGEPASAPGDQSDDEAVNRIVEDLYKNPLIKNINQESKKGIESLFRKITANLFDFGKDNEKIIRTGPSYIPAETFSSTLLERFKLPDLVADLTWYNLTKVANDEILERIKTDVLEPLEVDDSVRSSLHSEYNKLTNRINTILKNLNEKKTTLANVLTQIRTELETSFVKNSAQYFLATSSDGNLPVTEQALKQQKKIFDDRVSAIAQDVFGVDTNNEELLARIQPSLSQVTELVQYGLDVSNATMREIQDLKANQDGPVYQAFDTAYQSITDRIQALAKTFPPSLRESLAALGVRAQIKAKNTSEELNQFKHEIEVWFDRSMDRASGVYKRNAKGVAFLIGLVVAATSNADTFHMVSRLSTDNALQRAITDSASQVADSTDDIAQVRTAVDQALNGIALPIGWTSSNICQQSGLNPIATQRQPIYLLQPLDLTQICQAPTPQQTIPIGDQRLPFLGSRILGWALSALALTMGAPFWFELLNRIINVRNTGKRPPSSTSTPSSDSQQS